MKAVIETQAAVRGLVREELARYEAATTVAPLDWKPGAWWRAHASAMPNVALVARWLLSIPPSTAALERLFSAAGRGITRRRPRLQGRRGARLLYGHANVVRGISGLADAPCASAAPPDAASSAGDAGAASAAGAAAGAAS